MYVFAHIYTHAALLCVCIMYVYVILSVCLCVSFMRVCVCNVCVLASGVGSDESHFNSVPSDQAGIP